MASRKEFTENEILLKNFVKVRTNDIRLKHSLAADREIFETMPGLEKDFWRAVQLGVEKEFVVGELRREHFGFADEVLALPEGDDEIQS